MHGGKTIQFQNQFKLSLTAEGSGEGPGRSRNHGGEQNGHRAPGPSTRPMTDLPESWNLYMFYVLSFMFYICFMFYMFHVLFFSDVFYIYIDFFLSMYIFLLLQVHMTKQPPTYFFTDFLKKKRRWSKPDKHSTRKNTPYLSKAERSVRPAAALNTPSDVCTKGWCLHKGGRGGEIRFSVLIDPFPGSCFPGSQSFFTFKNYISPLTVYAIPGTPGIHFFVMLVLGHEVPVQSAMRAAATKVRAGRAAEDTPSWRQGIGTRKKRKWNHKQKSLKINQTMKNLYHFKNEESCVPTWENLQNSR